MTARLTRAALLLAGLIAATASGAAIRTVTSGADSGAGTLRQAILDAASAGDTITFAPGVSTVSLFSGDLTIAKSLTIAGPGRDRLRIQRVTDSGGPGFQRIFNISAGTVVISGVTIANGFSGGSQGDNVYNHGGDLTINNSIITGASDALSGGGGIMNGCVPSCGASVLTVNESTISGNLTSSGAGIYAAANSTTTIRNSTISNNTALNGGGGGVYIGGGTVLITGSTISGNSAYFVGGGISLPATGSLTIRNSTIAHNFISAPGAGTYGGGIHSLNGATLSSTIVANNTAPLAPNFNGPMYTEGFNLINDTSQMGYPLAHPADLFGVDPLLGPLQDNGGPTQTHALLSGSPAIDGGFANGFVTDQRGLARKVDGTTPNAPSGGDGADIGAYEVQADLLPGCSNINRIVQNGNDSGTDSLRDVITKVCAGSTITFAPGIAAVTLTTAELPIAKSLTIRGPGANLLSVQRSAAVGTPNFRIFNIGTGINVTLAGLTIANGYPLAGQGGGIRSSAGLALSGITLAGNAAYLGGSGGGLFNDTGNLTITDSTISGNSSSGNFSASGGGIHNLGGNVTIVNTTISGNQAVGGGIGGDRGGGISSDAGTVRFVNSTVTGNSADVGGGVYGVSGAVITVRNTIIALNSSANGADIYGALTSEGFNLVGNATGVTIAPAQFSDQLGVSSLNLNLGPLQNNGGPTPTHALGVGSFARDAGHASSYGNDQRGVPRPTDLPGVINATGGDGSDIGAFEDGVLSLDIDGNGILDPLTEGC